MSKKKILSLILMSSLLLNCQVYAETIGDVNNVDANIDLTTSTIDSLVDNSDGTTEMLTPTITDDSVEDVEVKSDINQLNVETADVESNTVNVDEKIDIDSENISVDEKMDVENHSLKLEPIEAVKIVDVVTELNEELIVSDSISHTLIAQQSNEIKTDGESVQSVNLSFNKSNDFVNNGVSNTVKINEKPVGRLLRLGSWNGDKPVGKLSYYGQMLPNTSFKNGKVGIIAGVVTLTGLLISGLYYYSKKVFD